MKKYRLTKLGKFVTMLLVFTLVVPSIKAVKYFTTPKNVTLILYKKHPTNIVNNTYKNSDIREQKRNYQIIVDTKGDIEIKQVNKALVKPALKKRMVNVVTSAGIDIKESVNKNSSQS